MTKAFLFATASLLAASASALPRFPILQQRQTTVPANATTFDDITPSTSLKWVDCYGPNIQCAYLTVPLDYADSTAGTINVAFYRYLLSETAEDLLFNPDNFVSFDPRGVKLSGPTISCSPSKDTKLRRRADGSFGNQTEAWQTTVTNNKACSAANEHSDAKYVGTSAVVQDMIHFTELQAALRGKDPSKATINYYGVSYGTLLGQTLVALYVVTHRSVYPDRLRRVVVDGNVYGVAHYQGWEPSGIDDFAQGIYLFNKLCYEAGEEYCILAKGAKSIDEVHARFDQAIANLNEKPVSVSGQQVDGEAFLGILQSTLYAPRSPQKGFLQAANYTYAAFTGDLGNLAAGTKLLKRDEDPGTNTDALGIITQVDIAGRYPWKTYEDWIAAAERITAPYYALNYAKSNGLIGAGSTLIPPPSQYFQGFKAIKPSAKVLFVNTIGDPVTPTSGARQMAKLFSGSQLLIVEGPGHGYASAPSTCANDVIAKYFKDGSVPSQETWCETSVDANYYFGGPDPFNDE